MLYLIGVRYGQNVMVTDVTITYPVTFVVDFLCFLSQNTVVLYIQVNEKSCRLRMATCRDGERRQDWDGTILAT